MSTPAEDSWMARLAGPNLERVRLAILAVPIGDAAHEAARNHALNVLRECAAQCEQIASLAAGLMIRERRDAPGIIK